MLLVRALIFKINISKTNTIKNYLIASRKKSTQISTHLRPGGVRRTPKRFHMKNSKLCNRQKNLNDIHISSSKFTLLLKFFLSFNSFTQWKNFIV